MLGLLPVSLAFIGRLSSGKRCWQSGYRRQGFSLPA